MQKEDISSDYLKLNELQELIEKINIKIEQKMQEWEELNQNIWDKKGRSTICMSNKLVLRPFLFVL